MKTSTRICVKAFALLLHLFPRRFQEEYGTELRGDFETTLEDARAVSRWEFLAVCLRELRDLPLNFLRTHVEKKRIYRFLQVPPVRFGWKGALAFGVSFAAANLIDLHVNRYVSIFEFNHVACVLQMNGCQEMANLVALLSSWVVGSLAGGVLFAVLFAGKFRFWRFAGMGSLAFLIPGLAYRFLLYSRYANLQWPNWAGEILTGLYLGMVIASFAKMRLRKIILVVAGAILYPIIAESSYRAIWKFFPPASSLFSVPAEVYRNVILEYLLAGLLFGILMGVILGWQRRVDKKS